MIYLLFSSYAECDFLWDGAIDQMNMKMVRCNIPDMASGTIMNVSVYHSERLFPWTFFISNKLNEIF